MQKIKRLFLTLSSLAFLFAAQPALAIVNGSDGSTSGGGSSQSSGSSSAATDPCNGVYSAETPSCSDCRHPKNGNPPSLCVCHPEYYYGSALSPAQYKSCHDCNAKGATTAGCLKNNTAVTALNTVVNVLAGIATMAIIGSIIVGGIQYELAGKPQDTERAKKRITNALIALFIFLFIYAFLQWLIPGGF